MPKKLPTNHNHFNINQVSVQLLSTKYPYRYHYCKKKIKNKINQRIRWIIIEQITYHTLIENC